MDICKFYAEILNSTKYYVELSFISQKQGA